MTKKISVSVCFGGGSKPIGKGGRGRVQGKGESPRENWKKVQVLWICRGVGVVPSRVIRDEYRI